MEAKFFVLAGAIVGVSAVVASGSVSAAALFKGHAGNPTGPTFVPIVTFAKQAEKAGVRIEVNAGKTLTKSLIALARGKIQFVPVIPSPYVWLGQQKRMYKKVKDGKNLQANVRSIFGYLSGTFHPITFASTGIKSFADIKGRSVYTGPPGGAATAAQEDLIRAVTGYEPNKEYKAIRLSWGQGQNAMRDGKLDVYFKPAQIGAASIQELALKSPIRLLSIPDSTLQNPLFKRIIKRPGRGVAMVEKTSYKGLANESDIRMIAAEHFLATNRMVESDVVYKAVKSFWNNLKDVHATALSLQSISKKAAFTAIEAPLHIGAYRYYKEAGFDIPARLVPPEAK